MADANTSKNPSPITNIPAKRALDASYYSLDEQELGFFKSQTGIQDENELKQHIMRVQADAYEVHPYPCILRFAFTKLKISRLPAYNQLLQIGRERPGAIFLDIGCCFGNDARKAIAGGFPLEGVIASDLDPRFWDLGHSLFRSTPATFPVPFVPGDAFDHTFLEPVPPFYAPPDSPAPALSSLTTLTPLLGHVSAIHASSLFHLFDEEPQLQLAKALAGLLAPTPGSMIFGLHGGRHERGLRVEQGKLNPRGTYMFCHSPESWTELWDGRVFQKGTVKVDAFLRETQRRDLDTPSDAKFYFLVWSVTRL